MVTNPLVEKSEKTVDSLAKPMVEIPSDMVTNPLVEKSEKTVDSLVKPMVEIPSEMITNPLVEVPSSERQKRRSKYKFPCKYCGKIFDFIGHMQIHEKTHTGELSHELSEKPVEFHLKPMVEIPSEMVTNPLVEKSEKPVNFFIKPKVEIS